MKLTDYQHLEQLAAKRGAILVDAADLLAWREEMQKLRAELEALEKWSRKAYFYLDGIHTRSMHRIYLVQTAPDRAKVSPYETQDDQQ